jgi:hypothetical protein
MSRRIRAFSSYIAEQNPEGPAQYDEIISVAEWNKYLKYAECSQIRVRYYTDQDDWFNIQLMS